MHWQIQISSHLHSFFQTQTLHEHSQNPQHQPLHAHSSPHISAIFHYHLFLIQSSLTRWRIHFSPPFAYQYLELTLISSSVSLPHNYSHHHQSLALTFDIQHLLNPPICHQQFHTMDSSLTAHPKKLVFPHSSCTLTFPSTLLKSTEVQTSSCNHTHNLTIPSHHCHHIHWAFPQRKQVLLSHPLLIHTALNTVALGPKWKYEPVVLHTKYSFDLI